MSEASPASKPAKIIHHTKRRSPAGAAAMVEGAFLRPMRRTTARTGQKSRDDKKTNPHKPYKANR